MGANFEIPYDAPRVGTGRYALLTRIGKGGMSAVYGAWDTRDRAWCAVKVLLPQFADRGAIRRRFVREGRAMMGIRDPHLVHVVDVSESEALPWMMMEFVPGGSLRDWSDRNGEMPERMVAECGMQVCLGLAAAHAANVVHRDVKPENILVGDRAQLKVTDFGVARVIDWSEDQEDTRTGMTLGTLGYMAPEQLANSKHADERCDVYSVGASMYRLLTRKPVQDLFRIADAPQRLEAASALEPVLARCLQYDPADRYPSAEALRAALQAVLPALAPVGRSTPPLLDGHTGPSEPMPLGGFPELAGQLDRSTTQALLHAAAHARPSPRTTMTLGVELAPAPSRPRRPSVVATLAAIALGLAPSIALAIAGPFVVRWGADEVESAALAHARAELALIEGVEQADTLPTRLEAAGLPVDPLVDALTEFHAAQGDARIGAAEQVVLEASRAAKPLGVLSSSRGEDYGSIRHEVQLLTSATDALQHTHSAWVAAARSPAGRFAVALGRASPPDDEP